MVLTTLLSRFKQWQYLKNLTIQNTSTVSSNVLQVGSVSTTPLSNATVRNTIIINGTNTSTAVVLGDAAIVGNPGYFNNITFRNNDIRKAYIGYYCYATVAAGNGNNTLITENFINSTGADAIRLVGIYCRGTWWCYHQQQYGGQLWWHFLSSIVRCGLQLPLKM